MFKTNTIKLLLNFDLYCPVSQGKEVQILNRIRLTGGYVNGVSYTTVNGEQYFNLCGKASPQILLELSRIEGVLINEKPTEETQ